MDADEKMREAAAAMQLGACILMGAISPPEKRVVYVTDADLALVIDALSSERAASLLLNDVCDQTASERKLNQRRARVMTHAIACLTAAPDDVTQTIREVYAEHGMTVDG